MIRTRIAVLSLVCLSLAHQTAAQQPALPVIEGDAPVIRVLSTGSGPMRPLRYVVAKGAKERIDMTMKASIAMDVPGVGPQSVDAPPMTISLDFDVTDVLPNGDFSLAMGIGSVSMEGGGLPSAMLDPMRGLSAAMTMTDRGVVKSLKLDSKAGDPGLPQLLSSSGFDKLSAPLPDEALGVGAKWEVVQRVTLNGMRMDQKSLYEVVAMDLSSTTLAVTMEQTAGAQSMAAPGMPAGIGANLIEMKGSGTGRMTLLDGVPALFGDLAIKSSVTMDMTMEGNSQRMVTETDMKMTMARGKR